MIILHNAPSSAPLLLRALLWSDDARERAERAAKPPSEEFPPYGDLAGNMMETRAERDGVMPL